MAVTTTPFLATPPPPRDTRGLAEIDPPASGARRDGPERRRFRPAYVAVAILALTAGILVVGAPGPWPLPHAAVQGVSVGGGSDVFSPAALTVTAGDSVTWTWQGGQHSVTSTGSEPFDSGSLSTGSFSHSFATAGTFSYVCTWHSGMTGSITVLAATTAATPAAPTGATPGTPAPTGATPATPAPADATPAASAPTSAPAASTPPTPAPGVVGTSPTASAPVARAGRPKLAGVRVRDRQLRFRLSESATVVALAFRGHSARGIRIGHLIASSGPGTLELRLDRLRPARYRLVVRAIDTGGQRSKRARLGYRLTRPVWHRAVDARRAAIKAPPAKATTVPPATAAPAATVPAATTVPPAAIVPPAALSPAIAAPVIAPAVTGAGGAPARPNDDGEDQSDDGGTSGSRSGSSHGGN